MEPKGLLQRKNQLLRVYEDSGDNLYTFYKDRYPEKNDERVLQWIDDATKNEEWAYYDAGVLPEIVIKPPKDNAVYKANYMIPNKELRKAFYNSIDSEEDYFTESADGSRDYNGDLLDQRTYINRLWNLYNKSGKPAIRPLSSVPFLTQLANQLSVKAGIAKTMEDRPFYRPIQNTMYVSSDYTADDIIAELSHAYQFRGTDTPRNLSWMKQFLSRPVGDIVINGKSGYDTPGSVEHVAHKIIEPAFYKYVTDNYYANQELPKNMQRSYNYEDAFRDIYTMYNNLDTYFKPIKIGPKKGM